MPRAISHRPPVRRTAPRPSSLTLVERFAPRTDASIVAASLSGADLATTWQVLRDFDLLRVRSPLISAAMQARVLPERVLRWVRGEPEPPTPAGVRLDGVGELLPGWCHLGSREGRELAVGAIGRFWTPRIVWYDDVTPDTVEHLEDPAWGRIVAGWRVEQARAGTVVVYEIRVVTFGPEARAAFLRYWRLIGWFVGYLARATVRTIALEADRAAGTSASDRHRATADQAVVGAAQGGGSDTPG